MKERKKERKDTCMSCLLSVWGIGRKKTNKIYSDSHYNNFVDYYKTKLTSYEIQIDKNDNLTINRRNVF